MAEPARPSNVIVDFGGMQTNIDSRDAQDGVMELQVNATCVAVGELKVRLGVREVTFEG